MSRASVSEVTSFPGLRRIVVEDDVMGTRASAHVIIRAGASTAVGTVPSVIADATGEAISAALASLHDADRRFSPFRGDSQVCRLTRGELSLADAHPDVREVEAACRAARRETAGRFDAWWRGWFDPTGYVKGWAVDRAVDAHLVSLLELADIAAVGLNVGGDLRLATAPGASAADGTPWSWRVGIADPDDRTRVLATLDLTDGAVATSGPAERGAHIVDPRTGQPSLGVRSATVVASALAVADLWATTAVVAGIDDLRWVADAGTRSGLLVGTNGRIRRWAGATEINLTGTTSPTATTCVATIGPVSTI